MTKYDRRRQGGWSSGELIKLVIGLAVIAFGAYIHGGFWDQPLIPGLDFAWQRSIVTIGVLIVLFPVIRNYFIVPLQEAIDTRNSELERTFTEAEELRASMDQLRRDYEQRLAATEASAREQIQAQIREAQNLRQTLMAEATQKADALVAQAEAQIEQEKSRALLEIRTAVVDLTMAATEKVIGANLDEARNRKLIEEFIAGVEVAH
jgi:F-type H+-transporting ATPase subunit b